MKKDYDFSKGERGKFFQSDAKVNLPVYLDDDNQMFVDKIAKRKGLDSATVVNELLRSDQKIAEVMN